MLLDGVGELPGKAHGALWGLLFGRKEFVDPPVFESNRELFRIPEPGFDEVASLRQTLIPVAYCPLTIGGGGELGRCVSERIEIVVNQLVNGLPAG